MSHHNAGKGSAPRPYSVDPKTFAENFNRILGNKTKPTSQESSTEPKTQPSNPQQKD